MEFLEQLGVVWVVEHKTYHLCQGAAVLYFGSGDWVNLLFQRFEPILNS